MKKRTILFGLILAMLLVALPLSAFATEVTDETTETTRPVREPGQCGENMTWAYEKGTLTISGTGEMDDYPDEAPWEAYRKEITKVVFTGGVTYVGQNAFADCDALTEVDFGDAMYELGTRSFYSCDGLTSISLPASFKIFGEESLRGCSKLREIHCQGRFPSFRSNCLWDTYVKIYFPVERPWGVEYIQQLEEAFHGRVEFLASDGSDPYVPTEATEPEETTQPTTEPTEPATEETTQPVEETTQPVTEPEVTQESQMPTRDSAPEGSEPVPTQEVPDVDAKTGSWVGIVIVVLVLAVLGLGILLVKPRRRGKYSR